VQRCQNLLYVEADALERANNVLLHQAHCSVIAEFNDKDEHEYIKVAIKETMDRYNVPTQRYPKTLDSTRAIYWFTNVVVDNTTFSIMDDYRELHKKYVDKLHVEDESFVVIFNKFKMVYELLEEAKENLSVLKEQRLKDCFELVTILKTNPLYVKLLREAQTSKTAIQTFYEEHQGIVGIKFKEVLSKALHSHYTNPDLKENAIITKSSKEILEASKIKMDKHEPSSEKYKVLRHKHEKLSLELAKIQ